MLLCHFQLACVSNIRTVGETYCESCRGGWDLGRCDFLYDRVCWGLSRLCKIIWSSAATEACHQQGDWYWGDWLPSGRCLGYWKWYHFIQWKCWSPRHYKGKMIFYIMHHVSLVVFPDSNQESHRIWLLISKSGPVKTKNVKLVYGSYVTKGLWRWNKQNLTTKFPVFPGENVPFWMIIYSGLSFFFSEQLQQNPFCYFFLQVGSRMVIVASGVLMVVMGVFGKVGAIFTTIPSPVIGGMFMVMFGVIAAAGVSNLQVLYWGLKNVGTFVFFYWSNLFFSAHIFSMQIWIHLEISSFLASPCSLVWSFLTGYWRTPKLLQQVD